MLLEHLIEMLITEIKFPIPPKKEGPGIYQISIHADQIITLSEYESGVFFHAKIVNLPDEKRNEELFIFLMQANILGLGTHGGAIGLDEKNRALTFSWTLPQALDYSSFRDSCEDFVNYLDFWKAEITKHLGTSSIL